MSEEIIVQFVERLCDESDKHNIDKDQSLLYRIQTSSWCVVGWTHMVCLLVYCVPGMCRYQATGLDGSIPMTANLAFGDYAPASGRFETVS